MRADPTYCAPIPRLTLHNCLHRFDFHPHLSNSYDNRPARTWVSTSLTRLKHPSFVLKTIPQSCLLKELIAKSKLPTPTLKFTRAYQSTTIRPSQSLCFFTGIHSARKYGSLSSIMTLLRPITSSQSIILVMVRVVMPATLSCHTICQVMRMQSFKCSRKFNLRGTSL